MKSPSTQTVCTLLSFSLLLGCQNTSLTESPAPEASQPSPAASAQPVAEASAAPATPSPTPAPEILSDLEYSARVMSAFEAQQKETIVWLQENAQPATVARLASPPTALSSEDNSSPAPESPSLPAELNKSMLSTIKAAAERLNTQLLELPYPPRLREGHQKLLRLIALQSKYFEALEAFFEKSNYEKAPDLEEMRQLLPADEMAEVDRLQSEVNTFLNSLLILSLEAEIEALHQVVIYDRVTYQQRIKPIFSASTAFEGLPNPLQYVPVAELARGPAGVIAVLEQRRQEAEANLAAIARIRPPAEYKESHLILYAQEKLNLLMLKLYQRQFASMPADVTSPQESLIHVMQQLFQDPDFLSMGLLIPLLQERAEAMQDKLKTF